MSNEWREKNYGKEKYNTERAVHSASVCASVSSFLDSDDIIENGAGNFPDPADHYTGEN